MAVINKMPDENFVASKATEKDLAALVINYLHDMGWEVYQEVQLFQFGKRADIVAVRDGISWIIETKMGSGLDVIQQAFEWEFHANYRSIAVPRRLKTRTFHFAKRVCKQFGIGVLEVDFVLSRYSHNVSETVPPKLYRTPYKRFNISAVLTDQHKTYAEAGNADGKYWSPFKNTCNEVYGQVKKDPGITMKKLLENISHHYCSDATARSSLVKWIELGKVIGIKIHREGRLIRLYPEDYDLSTVQKYRQQCL